jgi:superfamily II DNA or RNA helicase
MNKKIKGDDYEKFILEKVKNEYDEIYLWKNIPELVLNDMGFIGDWNDFRLEKIKYNKGEKYNYSCNYFQDTGIDIIGKKNNEYKFIQCKNWNNELSFRDISTFLAMSYLYDKNGILYYSQENGLSRNIRENKCPNKLQYINLPINKKPVENFYLYDYQINVIKKSLDFLKNKNRGIISLPCGTGKTEIMIDLSKSFKNIIILSPLCALAKQTYERFQKRLKLKKNQIKLVSSEGERDTNIKGVIIISSTFASVDIINQLNYDYDETLIIIDEYHNLSRRDLILEENESKTDMFKLIENKKNKILFVSATPKVFELDNDYEIELGEMIYKMSITEAINNSLICDYKIYYPLIENLNDFKNITNETNKITWFLNSISKLGLRKIIIYCDSKDKIDVLKNEINLRKDYYGLELNINSITEDDSSTQRLKKLKNFEDSKEINLLFSIRILDEGIDIPCCDGIFISYTSNSKIRNIQRIMRACRKHPEKNHASILYWCDDYENIDFLSSLKEYDPNLRSKLNIISNNYNNVKSTELENRKQQLLKIECELREYSWELNFDELKKYLNKNGKMPPDNIPIGSWAGKQRTNKRKDILSEKRIKLLETLPNWFWDKEKKLRWDKNYIDLEKYMEKNNKLPTLSDKTILGRWVNKQRDKKKKILLNDEQINKLEKIKGWSWEPYEESWIKFYNILCDYVKNNNDIPAVNSSGKLGAWINTQRTNKKRNIISKEKIELLEKVPNWKWYFDLEAIWNEKYEKIKNYIEKNQKLPSDKELLRWIFTQKKSKKDNKLSKEREELLKKINLI